MKKTTLLISFIFSISFSLYSQSKLIEFGVISGPSHSIVLGNNYTPNELNMNMNFDLFFLKGLSEKISFKSGVGYRNKGKKSTSKYTNNQGDILGDLEEKSSAHYINVPLLLHITTGANKRFFIDFGPYVAYLMKQTESTKGASLEYDYLNTTEVYTDLSKKIDIGLTVGLGFNIKLSDRVNGIILAQNELGLINISKTPVYGGGSVKYNSSSLMFGLSYNINN